jgi:hypothetical protein
LRVGAVAEMEKEGWTPKYDGVGRTAEGHSQARIEGMMQGREQKDEKFKFDEKSDARVPLDAGAVVEHRAP